MERRRLRDSGLWTGEVADGVRRVRDLLCAVDRVRKQRVEGQRDVQVETSDSGERPQRCRGFQLGVAQHSMDLGVELLPLSPPAQVHGNDVVETEAVGKLSGGQLQIARQPLCNPAIEGYIAVVFLSRDELRTDDRGDGAVLD